MQPEMFSRQRLTRAVLSALSLALLAPVGAMAGPSPSNVLRVAPATPHPPGAPSCTVVLFHNLTFGSVYDPANYTYTPPPGCAPPWAKVVLSMDLTGSRASGISGASVSLRDVSLFLGPTSYTHDPSTWHVERDLTDYSALLKTSGAGAAMFAVPEWGGEDGDLTGSAELRFYAATPARPAPRVPDAVLPLGVALDGSGLNDTSTVDLATLPHNIVLAFVDVAASDQALWYTCLPEATVAAYPTLLNTLAPGLDPPSIFPHEQGCGGGSYSELGLSVDGAPAGVAPIFPWLPTDLNGLSTFDNVLDAPMDSAQSLDFTPWRMDVSPFAAILNAPGSHHLAWQAPGHPVFDSYGAFLRARAANLLLYVDHHKAHVSGAVTFNSLAPGLPSPTTSNDLSQYKKLVEGKVRTQFDRDFEIRGFVDTSYGRVRTRVRQQSHFHNVQLLHVRDQYGLPSPYPWPVYREDLWLASTTHSDSRRTRNGLVIAEDQTDVSYPLELHYLAIGRRVDTGDGPYITLGGGRVAADQQRRIDVTHTVYGMTPFHTRVREAFYGSHKIDPDTGVDSNWAAAHTYLYGDSRGSCYQKARTTLAGAPDSVATGMGCPGGFNHLHWYTHPDGSPDGLTWLQP